MRVILGVTGYTILWCALENIIRMAFIAGYISMRSGQFKIRF